MIATVLVALDHSTRAPGVLAKATEIAERFDARLILFRAITVPPDFPPSAHAAHGDALPAYLVREAHAELDALAADNPRARVDRPVVAVGQPWRLIVDVADRLNVDLIVIGSHGYQGLDRLLGTTAARVANHAHRSVLIVHEQAAP